MVEPTCVVFALSLIGGVFLYIIKWERMSDEKEANVSGCCDRSLFSFFHFAFIFYLMLFRFRSGKAELATDFLTIGNAQQIVRLKNLEELYLLI
jgi:hypothetical protein